MPLPAPDVLPQACVFASGRGADTNDKEYESIERLWEAELADGKWYSKAEDWYVTTAQQLSMAYWVVLATSPLDVAESCTFLVEMFKLTGQAERGNLLGLRSGHWSCNKELAK